MPEFLLTGNEDLDRLAGTRRRRPDRLPLSGGQRRLWFVNQSDSVGTRYVIPLALRLHGQLDRAALHAALNDVVSRHESLRTVFPNVEGLPAQYVVPAAAAAVSLPVNDCDSAQLSAALRAEIGEPFELTRDLPVRAWLYAINADEHVLLLVMHHIASDAWSMRPLMRDLSVAYSARCAGRAPAWAPLPVQYSDYTLWHNDLLGAEADPSSMAGRQLRFWRKALTDLPLELSIPTDRPRPDVPSYLGDAVSIRLDAQLHQRIVELAGVTRTTPFMVLQAALVVLLSRLGAGTDIPIGTSIAGRTDEALDDLVGFFVNSVVLRTDTSGNPAFRELIARVREADLGAFRNQELPFDRVVEALNPPRSLARHPLFQILMTLRTDARLEPTLPGLEVAPVAVFSGISNFDLTFDFVEQRIMANRADGIELTVIYSRDLFDAATVRQLAERLLRVLDAAVADPDIGVSQIDLLGAAERERILHEWNATSAPVESTTLPRMFAEQVVRTPDRIAVSYEGIQLTYAELDSQAGRVARALLGSGVRPGVIVAVALPRSIELIVALYAVHKAGAAYLPIDPELPPARVESIVGDAQPDLVLTARQIAELLATPGTGEAPLPEISPELPAYVIYTSGSTGQPKGVLISHGAIVNRLCWMQHELPLAADDRVVHKTPTSFDVSVWELFWPLLVGARLVVARPDGHKDPAYLARLIDREDVTVAHFVPSMLDMFIAEPAAAACNSLRTVICSGESLTTELGRRWTAISAARLYNLYGPTEAAVDVTSYQFRPTERGTVVPVGRPVWNTQVYVLDERLQLVPPGVPGELYLAGAQLAIGYLNRQGLTAERFVASPFGMPGERMYRTGDMARWRFDGNLEFLGRNDDQVKIRGARVELGEITNALLAHDTVAQAVVIARDGQRPGGARVFAYVVLNDPATDLIELRRYLGRLLPDYMVPSAIVPVDALRLTVSGKVDRRALPDPEVPSTASTMPPSTQREKVLCRLFADVLGVPEVSVDDNFFALGGHSLLAMRLVARAREEAGIKFDVAAVFATPTVAGLASDMRLHARVDSIAPLLPLRATGSSQPPLFCLPPAAGISWVYSGLLGHLEPDQPVYGLQSPGLTDPDYTPSSLDDLVADHLERVQSVQPTGPYRLLGWSFGAVVAYAMATRLQAVGERVSLLAMLDGYPSPHGAARTLAQGDSRALADLRASLGYHGTEVAGDGPLSGLDPKTVSTLIAVFAGNLRLADDFDPDPFHGDVLFFVATADKSSASPTPMAWRPHVRGRLAVHEIDCAHGDMTRPGPLAEIGAVLTAAVRRRAPVPSAAHGEEAV